MDEGKKANLYGLGSRDLMKVGRKVERMEEQQNGRQLSVAGVPQRTQ